MTTTIDGVPKCEDDPSNDVDYAPHDAADADVADQLARANGQKRLVFLAIEQRVVFHRTSP